MSHPGGPDPAGAGAWRLSPRPDQDYKWRHRDPASFLSGTHLQNAWNQLVADGEICATQHEGDTLRMDNHDGGADKHRDEAGADGSSNSNTLVGGGGGGGIQGEFQGQGSMTACKMVESWNWGQEPGQTN